MVCTRRAVQYSSANVNRERGQEPASEKRGKIQIMLGRPHGLFFYLVGRGCLLNPRMKERKKYGDARRAVQFSKR